MELASLIAALSRPSAFPYPVDTVEVLQTHISVVFLAGSYVYKVKKPVVLGFLDYGTLEKRKHFCEREVALNRRLAPTIYLGVVPITHDATGLKLDGRGDAVEWAVKMERLTSDATLREVLRHGALDEPVIARLAQRLAQFHTDAERGPNIAACGRFEVVARNARENFEESAGHVGNTVSQHVFDRVSELTKRTLDSLRPLIEQRAERGVPRNGHGDLRLDHVYHFPGQPSPADLVVVDCIEFNDRFRYADPVADIAFIVMDLIFEGRRDLARLFADAYFAASGDAEGRALLSFYTAYRAVVRAKVEGIELGEPEVPDDARHRALVQARGHWLLALGQLEAPVDRPCLVLVIGLPGAGKSTLASALAERCGFELIRTDAVRKELARSAGLTGAGARFGEGIYSDEWTEQTYAECLRRAELMLFEGRRVLIDANFRTETRRRTFQAAARRHGVPFVIVHCDAAPTTVRERLERRHGDASDADWEIYQRASARWEAPGPAAIRVTHAIDTGQSSDAAVARAIEVLRAHGLN